MQHSQKRYYTKCHCRPPTKETGVHMAVSRLVAERAISFLFNETEKQPHKQGKIRGFVDILMFLEFE
jgi:hypothetical protein